MNLNRIGLIYNPVLLGGSSFWLKQDATGQRDKVKPDKDSLNLGSTE